MSQPFSWTSSQRRGKLPQIQTASNANPQSSSNRTSNPSTHNSPARNTFSPTGTSHFAPASSTARHNGSRTSSVSSTSSPFSPSHNLTGVQQAGSSLLHSSRGRTIPPSAHPQLPSAVAAAQGGASGDGGSKPRLRASPSLSQSSDVGSPIPQSATSAPFSGSGGVASIDIAQISIQLARLDKEKDPQKLEEGIRSLSTLLSRSMEVTQYTLRKLIRQHASRIFGNDSSTDHAGSFTVLSNEVEAIRTKPEQARKIADAIDASEGEPFRDFDLSSFMERFRLDPVAKCMLALALKTASKADLKTKADAILSSNLQTMLMVILNPNPEVEDDLPPVYLAALIDRLLQNPPRNWNEEIQSNLNFAIRARYERLGQPTPSGVLSTMQLAELTQPSNDLVRLVQRTGERATSSVEACKEMLATAETRQINFNQVASVLLFMVITQNGEAYNPSIFVQALKEHRAGRRLDWQDVVGSFDREGLVISKPQFLALYNALLPLAREYENFDIQLLWGGSWAQIDTQLSFVVAFLSCTSEELNADEIPRLRRAYHIETFEEAADEVKAFAAQAVQHPLVSLDATGALFKMIFQNGDTYKHASNLGIPEAVINPHTPYFVVASAAVPQPWGGLQDQAFDQLFIPFLKKGLDGYSFVFHGLWNRDNQWLAERLVKHHARDPLSISYIYEHAMEHNFLGPLTGIPNEFGLDLACYAHGHGEFDIESWLQEAHALNGHNFPNALGQFVDEKARADSLTQKEPTAAVQLAPLTVDTAYVLLTWLGNVLPEDILIALHRTAITAYPRLINYGEGFDSIISENSKSGNAISPQADAAMQEHFKALYNRETDVKSMIESLQRYKNSEQPAEQELFACMIQGLFDEYTCFGEYPADALATTAVLFGSIINYNLLSSIALQAGLSMVLEALQTATSREEKMYKFGLQALLHFQSRLKDWPTFCEKLLAITELHGTEAFRIADEIVRSRIGAELNGDIPNGTTNGIADEITSGSSHPFSSVHVDPPLRPDIYQEPDEETTDRVVFAVNNISDRNVEEKFRDIQDAVIDPYHQWFAVHLVEDRARTQPNYHELFLKLLRLFDSNWLWKEVIRETIGACARLLNADATMTSTNDRNHLKNLGTWLGLLTVARDKPILYRNISFVDLLVEAHKSKRLILVIPFVCRVLKVVGSSKTFSPPNPWTNEILSILLEFYHHIDMKIQLKFEVEVLCKEIGADMKKLEPAVIIRECDFAYHQDDFGAHVPEDLAGFNDLTLANFTRQNNRLGDRFSPQALMSSLPDISGRLLYPPSTTNNQITATQTREIFQQAAVHAINEIIFPVVERSVTIAGISASNLVMKDFATEADVEKFRKAAHSLVKSLAGSLALVTCREPLKMSMTNNVRILARSLPSESLPEGIIIMFVNDNIDAVCKVVEEAAEKQSVAVIDDAIQEGLAVREQHSQQQSGEPFQWPTVHRFARMMPEPYKPSEGPGGLTPQQLAIYDNFGPTRTGVSQIAAPDGRNQLPDFESGMTNLPTPAGEHAQLNMRGQPSPQAQDVPRVNGYSNSLEDMLNEVFQAAQNAPEEITTQLPPNAPVKEAYTRLVRYLAGLPRIQADNMIGHVGDHVLQILFAHKINSRLEVEVAAQLLAEICNMSSLIGHHIWQVLNESDMGAFLENSKMTIALLTRRLIPMQKVDRLLAGLMAQREPSGLLFMADILDNVLFSEYPTALRADFSASIEALNLWMLEQSDNELGAVLLERLRNIDSEPSTSAVAATKQDQHEHIFDEWIHYYRNGMNDKTSFGFVQQLLKQGVLNDIESTSSFLRACIETSIGVFESEDEIMGQLDGAYFAIDALAHLIVLLVRHQGPPEGAVKPTKPIYLDSLLSLVAIIQCHHNTERGAQSNHKIFFRLYSSLLCLFHDARDTLGSDYNDIVLVFGQLLHAVQPKWMPGFIFNWLALVTHRYFMNPVLQSGSQQKGWDMYASLLEIVLRQVDEVQLATHSLRETSSYVAGLLRHLLILHHDYQDFVAENHARLCAATPAHCSQVRNLINMAHPSSVTDLPDPLSTGLKIDRLEEMRQVPTVRLDLNSHLEAAGLKAAIDDLIASKRGSVTELAARLSGCDDRGALAQEVVLYLGSGAINAAGTKTQLFNKQSPHFVVLRDLIAGPSASLADQLLQAIFNQLRYPNAHTYWFSQALLELFTSAVSSGVEHMHLPERIAAIMLEHLFPVRPLPWGLTVTFRELVSNKECNFQSLPFVQEHNDLWSRQHALESAGSVGVPPGMGGF